MESGMMEWREGFLNYFLPEVGAKTLCQLFQPSIVPIMPGDAAGYGLLMDF